MTKALLYVWNYPILAKEQQSRSLICFLIKMKVLLNFAHELFIIYPKNHSNIKLIPLNVCDDVQTMINHVKNS